MENIFTSIENTINYFFTVILEFDYLGFLWYMFSLLTFESLLKLIIIYFFIVWIAIIIWVTKDIINRTNNILLQVFSILTVLFGTPLWTVVYLLIRPSKTLFEKYYDEVSLIHEDDIKIWNTDKEKMLVELASCPNCFYEIQEDFKFCPNCRVQVKKECHECYKKIDMKWKNCPYCWTAQEEIKENISWESEKPSIENENSFRENTTEEKNQKDISPKNASPLAVAEVANI